MKDLAFHEIANFWPMMEDEAFDRLVEDIREHGQRVPIEVWEGKVIDGRNRYRACLFVGVEPECVEVDLTGQDVLAYVRSLNDHRRHMTASQLGVVAAKALAYYEAKAKERQKVRKGDQPGASSADLHELQNAGRSADQAGADFGVSGRTVAAAKRVLERGSPAVIKAVEQGKVSVSSAETMSVLPHDAQDEWLKKGTFRPERHVKPNAPEPTVSDKPGVGVIKANEAVNALSRIPRNDPLRKRGFQIVTDWIRKNK